MTYADAHNDLKKKDVQGPTCIYMLFKLADFTSSGKKKSYKSFSSLYRFHIGLLTPENTFFIF